MTQHYYAARGSAFPAISLAIAVATLVPLGCKRSDRKPAPAGTALEKVRALKLSRPVSWQTWDATTPPSLRSQIVSPEDGLKLWHELRKERAAIGMVPVVMDATLDPREDEIEPPPEQLPSVEAFFANRADTVSRWTDLLVDIEKIPAGSAPKTWAELVALCKKAGAECPEEDPVQAELDRLATATIPPIPPPREPSFEFVGRNARTTELERENPGLKVEPLQVRVVLVAAQPHELPLHLKIGGWNACPFPDEHALVLESWGKRYGAELVFYGGDTLELWVERPPATADELKRVAREQFLYCEDIVFQGAESTVALAGELAGARSWYFWWD